jgi:hypothetical protein
MPNNHGGKRPGAGRKPKAKPTYGPDRRKFTVEQIKTLEQSPHTSHVTQKTVSFTLAFKEMFWDKYSAGTLPETIFREADIDPEMLGKTRVYGFLSTLRKQKEKAEPFREGRDPIPEAFEGTTKPKFDIPKLPRPPKIPKSEFGDHSERDVEKLFHTVAYLTQEMEFIKKIILADNGGKSK